MCMRGVMGAPKKNSILLLVFECADRCREGRCPHSPPLARRRRKICKGTLSMWILQGSSVGPARGPAPPHDPLLSWAFDHTLHERFARSAKDVEPSALAQPAALRGRRRGGGGMVRASRSHFVKAEEELRKLRKGQALIYDRPLPRAFNAPTPVVTLHLPK